MRCAGLSPLLAVIVVGLALLAPGGARSTSATTIKGDAVLRWTDATLDAIRTGGHGPPMAARALAIVHTCMYDAWAAYDDTADGTMLGDALRRPSAEHTEANKTEALSYAASDCLVDLYPNKRVDFNAVLNGLGLNPADRSTDLRTPAGIGHRAATAVLEYRRGDGSNQLGNLAPGAYADTSRYVPVNALDMVFDPNHWQPLRFVDAAGNVASPRYVGPHWGQVTPFALTSGDQFRPPPPAQYPGPAFVEQAQDIVELTAHLTDREKVIAEYWADGPASELPPGHWNLFAQYVAERNGYSLDQQVKLFFALNNALMDAGIATWEAKRYYDSTRPITAIRYLYSGQQIQSWGGPYQGTVTIDGALWVPYQPAWFITPPFPEHTSGHSAFSAAAAEVLQRFTGSDRFESSVTIPAGWSRIEPGAVPSEPVTLTWQTFSEAADEAGWSRRYGGIHFAAADMEGRILGRKVAAVVWDRAQVLFSGRSVPLDVAP